MKKTVIIFSGVLTAAISLSASAQTPEWFILKHPEVKVMERMQAHEAVKEKTSKQPVAMHDTATWDQTPEWFVIKHPEVKVMERMQAQEAAKEKANKQQIAMHDTDWHHAINRDSENESHSS